MEDACKSYPKCGVNALTIETTVNIENSATTHIPIPHRNITTQKIILLRVHRSYICRLTFAKSTKKFPFSFIILLERICQDL